MADFDLDGDLDIALAAMNSVGSVFENDGTGHFTDVTASSSVNLSGFALIPFDYDRDGDIDLLVNGQFGLARLLENKTATNGSRHWLMVRAVGTHSNRDGIGARITATVGTSTMIREILGGFSFVSGTVNEAHFGLGAATVVDQLRIDWPSGQSQVLSNVPADQLLTVTEPVGDCLFNDDCLDTSVCTFDRCDVGVCNHLPNTYGDLNHDDVVSIFDLFCVLDGLQNTFADCSLGQTDIAGAGECTANGVVNIFDLFAVLDALSAINPCCSG